MKLQEIIDSHKNKNTGTSEDQINITKNFFLNENIKDEDIGAVYFTEVEFKSMTFNNTDAVGAYFFNCTFINVDFQKVNLRKSEFYDCFFTNCSFINCDITKVEFVNLICKKTNFDEVKLGWTFFNKSIIDEPVFKNISLENTMFLNTKIGKAKILNLLFNKVYPLKFNNDNLLKEVVSENDFLEIIDN